jgi:hypothetical protein
MADILFKCVIFHIWQFVYDRCRDKQSSMADISNFPIFLLLICHDNLHVLITSCYYHSPAVTGSIEKCECETPWPDQTG